MRIRPRLILTTAAVTVSILFVGGIGLVFTNYATAISKSLVEQQTKSIIQIYQIEKQILELRQRFLSHGAATDPTAMQLFENEITALQYSINELINDFEGLALEQSNTLQNTAQYWQSFIQLWREFQQAADKNLRLSQDFMKQEALEDMLNGQAQELYALATLELEVLTKTYYEQMQTLQQSAETAENSALIAVIVSVVVVGLLVLIILNRFASVLLTPLESATRQLQSLAEGRLMKQEIPIYHEDDEIAEIVWSIRRLQERTENVVAQSNAIAEGDYSQTVELRSEEDTLGLALFNMTEKLRQVMHQANAIAQGNYKSEITPLSDKDQLGNALVEMTTQLREVTAANEQQDWLKTGQNKLNDAMSGEHDVNNVADKVIKELASYLSVSFGAFYLSSQDTDNTQLKLIAQIHEHERTLAKLMLNEDLPSQMGKSGQQVYIENILDEKSPLASETPNRRLVAPFFYDDTLRGVIELGAAKEFTALQRELIDLVLPRIGIIVNLCETHAAAKDKWRIAEENLHLQNENTRMSAALDITRQLQTMILPSDEELLAVNTLDIACWMQPADEVGGDYYDVLQYHDKVIIGIGDVTGHGLASGVLMLMVQTAIRTLSAANISDSEAFFQALNRTIYDNVQRMGVDKNLTLMVVDYQAGHLRVSGQHEELLVVRRSGQIERLDTFDLGFMIGVTPDITQHIRTYETELRPGDGILMYTDGITEARNKTGVQYGLAQLCEIVEKSWGKSASDIQTLIIDDFHQHTKNTKIVDDYSVMIMKQMDA
ncbi:MAG: SpoIIE family protein phosphatase [Pseudomonadota bacterium]